MNSRQFKRYLAKHGCRFETGGKGGHITVIRGDRRAILPTHGGRKQLGTGLMNAILKQLNLKE